MRKKVIKIVGMILVLGIGVTALTSCGSSESSSENTSAQVELIE